MKYQISWK